MKISASESFRIPAWSGRISDVKRLAELIEQLAESDVAIREAAAEKETYERMSYYRNEDERRANAREAGDTARAALRPVVTLAYRKHSAKHEGTVEELDDVDTHGLAGITVTLGNEYSDGPFFRVAMDPEKIEAKIRSSDTNRLVGSLAALREELDRCRPGWAIAWSRWKAPTIASLIWFGLCFWWPLRIVRPIHVAIQLAIVFCFWVFFWLAALYAIRKRLVPSFEMRDDTGDGPVRATLRRVGWVVPVVIALLGLMPVFL